MLIIPFRKTLDLDLSSILALEVRKQLDGTLLSDARPSVTDKGAKTDAFALNNLRKEATSDLANTDAPKLLGYAAGLLALSSKTELSNITFPWANAFGYSQAIVQGNGVWFEILNVLLNIAAFYTARGSESAQGDAIRFYREAAGVLEYAEHEIVPRLAGTPPPEISRDSLKFFRNWCLAQALDLESADGAGKWQAHELYQCVLESLQKLSFKNGDWEHALKGRSRELGSQAYLDIAKSLHRSRRIEDRLQEKSALMKCIELTKSSLTLAEANNMLHEPFGRRSKTSLVDVDDSPIEVPGTYFEKRSIEPIEFSVPSSDLFSNVLPVALITGPQLLREKLLAKLNADLCSELHALNRSTLLAVATYHIPAAVELAHAPDKVPEFLIQILDKLPSAKHAGASPNNGVKNQYLSTLATDTHTDLERCRSILSARQSDKLSEDQKTLQNSLKEAEMFLAKIDKMLDANREILDLVSSQGPEREERISVSLGFAPRLHPSKSKSKPVFLTKVETFYENTQVHIKERDLRRAQILEKASCYDFHAEVLKLLDVSAHKSALGEIQQVSLGDLDVLLNEAILSFSDSFAFLEHEKKVVDLHISRFQELESQFNSYNKPLSNNSGKLAGVRAMVLAAVLWSDIEYDLLQLTDTLSKIEALASNVIVNSSTISDLEAPTDRGIFGTSSQEHAAQFCWRPGMKINITS